MVEFSAKDPDELMSRKADFSLLPDNYQLSDNAFRPMLVSMSLNSSRAWTARWRPSQVQHFPGQFKKNETWILAESGSAS
jgi:hypothetical protein